MLITILTIKSKINCTSLSHALMSAGGTLSPQITMVAPAGQTGLPLPSLLPQLHFPSPPFPSHLIQLWGLESAVGSLIRVRGRARPKLSLVHFALILYEKSGDNNFTHFRCGSGVLCTDNCELQVMPSSTGVKGGPCTVGHHCHRGRPIHLGYLGQSPSRN